MTRTELDPMMQRITSNRIWKRSKPTAAELEGRSGLLVAGLLAIVLGSGSGLAALLQHGASPGKIALFLALSLTFLALSQAPRMPWAPVCWLLELLWPFLLLMGGLAFVLLVLSGDPFLQPVLFTIPLVFAALEYGPARTFAVGALYLGVMALGLLLAGTPYAAAIVFPVAAYGSTMGLIAAFTQLSKRQTEARVRADELAAALERERDQLSRLAQVTATLGSDIDLQAVVEQVARAGRELAGAESARVWLLDAGVPRLAALAPPLAEDELSSVMPPALNQDLQSADTHRSSIIDHRSIVLPLAWKGERIGLLELYGDRGSVVQPAPVLRPFANAAAAAIQNARLFEQAGQSATLAERNRLARELHDTIAQGLTALSMQLEAAQRAFDRDGERARARLARAGELARETLGDVRRSVWTLAAPLEDGQALVAALDDSTRRFTGRSGVPARYVHTGAQPALGHGVATQVLRIVGEALVNVEKHAGASSVEVASELDGTRLRVRVRDDGAGFEAGVLEAGAAGGGFGLFSLRERARLAGGILRVESSPGDGTMVELCIAGVASGKPPPLAADADEAETDQRPVAPL